MNDPYSSIARLINEINDQNTKTLRSLDISDVVFDDNYYNNRYRIVHNYKLTHINKRDPLSIRIINSLLTLFIGILVIICPILPLGFALSVTIRNEEEKINSEYR